MCDTRLRMPTFGRPVIGLSEAKRRMLPKASWAAGAFFRSWTVGICATIQVDVLNASKRPSLRTTLLGHRYFAADTIITTFTYTIHLNRVDNGCGVYWSPNGHRGTI